MGPGAADGAERPEDVLREGPEPADDPAAPPRPWSRAVGFGIVAGLLTGFALLGLIAAPLFLWAKATEPELGLQRPFVRNGLRAAPVIALAAFALTAVLAARWRLRQANGPSAGRPE